MLGLQDKVNKNIKQTQARKAGKGGGAHAVEDAKPAAGPPRRWHDYTVWAAKGCQVCVSRLPSRGGNRAGSMKSEAVIRRDQLSETSTRMQGQMSA